MQSQEKEVKNLPKTAFETKKFEKTLKFLLVGLSSELALRTKLSPRIKAKTKELLNSVQTVYDGVTNVQNSSYRKMKKN